MSGRIKFQGSWYLGGPILDALVNPEFVVYVSQCEVDVGAPAAAYIQFSQGGQLKILATVDEIEDRLRGAVSTPRGTVG